MNVADAMGVAQIEQLPGFLQRKREIIAFYKQALLGVGDISFQEVSEDVQPNWWMPTIFTSKQREVLKVLNEKKMQSRPFWVPMNQLPMFTNDPVSYTHLDVYKRQDRSCVRNCSKHGSKLCGNERRSP